MTQYRVHAMSKLATSTFAWPHYTIWSGVDLTWGQLDLGHNLFGADLTCYHLNEINLTIWCSLLFANSSHYLSFFIKNNTNQLISGGKNTHDWHYMYCSSLVDSSTHNSVANGQVLNKNNLQMQYCLDLVISGR